MERFGGPDLNATQHTTRRSSWSSWSTRGARERGAARSASEHRVRCVRVGMETVKCRCCATEFFSPTKTAERTAGDRGVAPGRGRHERRGGEEKERGHTDQFTEQME